MKRCLRCGYTWTPQVQHPIVCARCKSSLWDVPRATGNERERLAKIEGWTPPAPPSPLPPLETWPWPSEPLVAVYLSKGAVHWEWM